MSRKSFVVRAELTIAVELDDEVIARCVENQDDEGVPRPDERGSRGWRNVYYDLRTPELVAEHLAFNLAIRERRLSTLDGWADLGDGLASAAVVDAEYVAEAVGGEERTP